MTEPVEVVADTSEFNPCCSVWGTGGWLPPKSREALDWATFVRMLGWGVQVSTERLSSGSRWIIIARSPDNIGEEIVRQLSSRLVSERILVVARAARAGSALQRLACAGSSASAVVGSTLEWVGPGPSCRWRCRRPVTSSGLSISDAASTWATLDGAPIIAARRVGCGVFATLSFHPSEIRDQEGAVTALLRNLLIRGTGDPVAWLDFEGTLVLRMDDPGGAQNIYSKSWYYPKLRETAWQEIGSDLKKREGRLSIGYVAGWVDDGDVERGSLKVDSKPVDRIPGAVHPSPLVTYQESSGTIHDYAAEFRGIQALRAAGLAEVELHGYTHIHPDRSAWLRAPDRYESVAWYRELGIPYTGPHALESGLAAFQKWFLVRPSTLICPGDQWTNAVLERAIELGFELVSSYYLGIRDSCRLLWVNHVCAPYLDTPDAAWFDAGLPVVGYFHDRELALEGSAWMSACLDAWQAAGANRFVDLRELAASLSLRISLKEDPQRLVVTTQTPFELVKPVVLGLYVPGIAAAARSLVTVEAARLSLDVQVDSNGFGRILVSRDLSFDHKFGERDEFA
jgi:hypothetical protein